MKEAKVIPLEKVQELRNWAHEQFFTEQHYMNMFGDTRSVNVLQTLMNKLDWEFGTKYEKTESQIKYEPSKEDDIEQGSLF